MSRRVVGLWRVVGSAAGLGRCVAGRWEVRRRQEAACVAGRRLRGRPAQIAGCRARLGVSWVKVAAVRG